MELSGVTFVFIFFTESGNKYRNPENKYKNRYVRKQIWTEYGAKTEYDSDDRGTKGFLISCWKNSSNSSKTINLFPNPNKIAQFIREYVWIAKAIQFNKVTYWTCWIGTCSSTLKRKFRIRRKRKFHFRICSAEKRCSVFISISAKKILFLFPFCKIPFPFSYFPSVSVFSAEKSETFRSTFIPTCRCEFSPCQGLSLISASSTMLQFDALVH